MASFLDKLKKGMGVKDLSDSNKEEEIKEAEEEPVQLIRAEAPLLKKAKKTKLKKEYEAPEISTMEMPEPETLKPEPKKIKPMLIPEPKKIIKVQKEKSWFDQEGQLTIDMYETEKSIVVKSAIAGIKPEDLDISVENDMLIIKGKREEQKEEQAENYFYQECYWGRFSREIVLPQRVDPSKVEASMKDGVLTIKIPKLSDGDGRIRIREE